MVWIIQPMERKDPKTNQGSGKWDLVARSDEGGGFWPALPTPNHPGFDTAEEAAADPVARSIANATAGLGDMSLLMSFGEALEQLKKGRRIARRPWGEGMFVFCDAPHPGLMLKTRGNDATNSWMAASEDLLADDWHIA